jgi:hypothetical protein
LRAVVFVSGLGAYAAFAVMSFPLDGASDDFGRALVVGLLGLVTFMATVTALAAWRIGAPGIFNGAISTLLWTGMSIALILTMVLPNIYAEVGLTGSFVVPLRIAAGCMAVIVSAALTAQWTADAASSDVIITD